jgi:hypothetical protein
MKALLIGIDYFGSKIASNYNTHDVNRINHDLLGSSEEVKVMIDSLNPNNSLYPNYENLTREISEFITLDENVSYLFVYCGYARDKHDKIKDENGERLTGALSQKASPTSILPRGEETQVIDAYFIRVSLIDKLPLSCKLTCVMSANFGHDLLPTKYIYDFKRAKFMRSSFDVTSADKDVLCISFSSDEISPIEMSLMAPDGSNDTPVRGSLGIFALIALIEEIANYDGGSSSGTGVTFNAWCQALLKKLVANNPSKNKTYNMLTIGSESIQCTILGI